MQTETNKPNYSFIKTYKQRVKEILSKGKICRSIQDIAILIDKEDEYVLEFSPYLNIKKGSPFTELFLAVYDWCLTNYTCTDDINIETFIESFSYILLDPSNYTFEKYKFDTKSNAHDPLFHSNIEVCFKLYDDIEYRVNISKLTANSSAYMPNNLQDLYLLFPMRVNNRRLEGYNLKHPAPQCSASFGFIAANGIVDFKKSIPVLQYNRYKKLPHSDLRTNRVLVNTKTKTIMGLVKSISDIDVTPCAEEGSHSCCIEKYHDKNMDISSFIEDLALGYIYESGYSVIYNFENTKLERIILPPVSFDAFDVLNQIEIIYFTYTGVKKEIKETTDIYK